MTPQEKLKEILTVLNDGIGKKEFRDNFGRILEFLKNLKTKNKEEFTNLKKSISDLSEQLKGDNTTNISSLKEEFIKIVEKALKEQEDGMNFIRDKVRRIKEGVDGKDGRNGIDGRPGRDGKDGKDAPAETPRQIKKNIKLLKKKLRIKDIKNLRKELDELKKLRTIMTGGGSGTGGHIVKCYDLSASLNGVLKTFSLPAFWRVISVHSSSFPNAFRPTTDYTTNASLMTITFTSQIKVGTTLATGQTIIVTYSE